MGEGSASLRVVERLGDHDLRERAGGEVLIASKGSIENPNRDDSANSRCKDRSDHTKALSR